MVYFDSAQIYVESCTTIQGKITAINAIQDALLTSALAAASQGAISHYTLNDGQTIISTTYRSASAVKEAYNDFEAIKQMYINRLNGRVVRLVDSKNFTNNRFH